MGSVELYLQGIRPISFVVTAIGYSNPKQKEAIGVSSFGGIFDDEGFLIILILFILLVIIAIAEDEI
jgi:hypothetical protein